MILVDTNVWLSATLAQHPTHRKALDWFADQAPERSLLFCRATEQSFLRLLTTESLLKTYGAVRATNVDAWRIYENLRLDSRVSWLAEPVEISAIWKKFTMRNEASPKLWMDAYLAAFAVAGNHQLVTFDNAFTQFKGLKLVLL